MILLKQMIVLFIIMLLGYYLAKKDVLDTAASGKISWIVVNVCNPALVLSAGVGEDMPPLSGLGQVVVIAVSMYVVLLLLAQLLPRLLRVGKDVTGAYRVMTVFSNLGFMGFPILSAMYGSGALLYGSIFTIPYNLLIYTYGISAIGGKGGAAGKEWKKILNIGTAACIVTIAIYGIRLVVDVPIPTVLSQTVSLLSGMTAPLSMMVIGAALAAIPLKELVQDKKLLLFAGIRLLVIPLLFLLALRLFISDSMMLGVCLVMIGTPVGSMTAMLSRQYGGDVRTTSRGVALTTALSVATLPLLFWIMGL